MVGHIAKYGNMVLGDVELLKPKSLHKYTIPVIHHTLKHDYVLLAYIREYVF